MSDSFDELVLQAEIVERDIAKATELRDRWQGYVDKFKKNGGGRLRINDQWESDEQALARLQSVVDNHSRTVELLERFRAIYPSDDH